MKLTRIAIVVYVGLVFASGVVLGAFGHRLYMVSSVISASKRLTPEEWRKKAMDEYRTRLKLTDEQVAKLNSIYDETRARVHEVHEKQKPELDAIRKDQVIKFKSVLTPEQQVEYDKIRKEREEHQKQIGERPPGPGF
jgi:Spy/CpxP family protein refolding chaperone